MNTSKSIAVLPFKNLSSDSNNEYFSDGLTEEIINSLTKIDGLKVTARTSSFAFKNVNIDIKTIGKQLNVSLILEGSVRTAAGKIRITAQLSRVSDGFNVWSETFDRELKEIFELQDEISLLIADQIRENSGHLDIDEHLNIISTKSIEAYQHYLKAKEFYNTWDMSGFLNAAHEYEKSIAIDPTFDLPYFGAGLSYSFLGSWGTMNKFEAFEKVNHFFSLGNNLNKASSFGHFSMAKHLFWGLWDFEKAYIQLNKAYQLLPQDASINEFMSEINALAGNFLTAKKHIDTSIQINPLSPTHYYTKGQILFLQNDFVEAIKTLREGIKIDPKFSISKELLMACLILQGDEIEFKKTLDLFDNTTKKFFTGLFRLVHINTDFNEDLLKGMYNDKNIPLLSWDLYVLVYQNKTKVALDLLKQKVEHRMGNVLYLKYDPFLKPLHGNESFRELAVRSNLETQSQRHVSNRSKSSQLTEKEIIKYTNDLLNLMEAEKPYLNPGLNLKILAQKINLHPNKLSWLLNESINKNFYSLVNEYRLKAFKEKALNPSNKHLSILGLALESGFNSKSVFNDFFKRNVGLTPKDWLKQNKIFKTS